MADKPSHHVYSVRDFEANGEKDAFWTKVGAAWQHGDGKGFNVQLDAFPVNGRLVIRTPREQKPE